MCRTRDEEGRVCVSASAALWLRGWLQLAQQWQLLLADQRPCDVTLPHHCFLLAIIDSHVGASIGSSCCTVGRLLCCNKAEQSRLAAGFILEHKNSTSVSAHGCSGGRWQEMACCLVDTVAWCCHVGCYVCAECMHVWCCPGQAGCRCWLRSSAAHLLPLVVCHLLLDFCNIYVEGELVDCGSIARAGSVLQLGCCDQNCRYTTMPYTHMTCFERRCVHGIAYSCKTYMHHLSSDELCFDLAVMTADQAAACASLCNRTASATVCTQSGLTYVFDCLQVVVIGLLAVESVLCLVEAVEPQARSASVKSVQGRVVWSVDLVAALHSHACDAPPDSQLLDNVIHHSTPSQWDTVTQDRPLLRYGNCWTKPRS